MGPSFLASARWGAGRHVGFFADLMHFYLSCGDFAGPLVLCYSAFRMVMTAGFFPGRYIDAP
jgi:hypothetical protein